MNRKLFALSLCLAFPVSAAIASNPPKTIVVLNHVKQSTAPLQITSVQQTVSDLAKEVTVKNVSGKTVVDYQLGWAAIVPQGCATQSIAPVYQSARPDQITVEPGSTATAKDYNLNPSRLWTRARNENAAIMDVQIAVLSVDFEDGSSWNYKRAGRIFDPIELAFRSTFCESGALKPSAIQQCGKPSGSGSAAHSSLDSSSTFFGKAAHPDGGFSCGSSGNPTSCQNGGGIAQVAKCTDVQCGADYCPNQECVYNQ